MEIDNKSINRSIIYQIEKYLTRTSLDDKAKFGLIRCYSRLMNYGEENIINLVDKELLHYGKTHTNETKFILALLDNYKIRKDMDTRALIDNVKELLLSENKDEEKLLTYREIMISKINDYKESDDKKEIELHITLIELLDLLDRYLETLDIKDVFER